MAFRLLRIVSCPLLFEVRLNELAENVLKPRDYKPAVIKSAFDKVRKISREEALKKVEKEEKTKAAKNRVVAPFDYNPRTPKIGKILTKHHQAMIRKNKSLKEVFVNPPMAGLRQSHNLRRTICRAKLYQPPNNRPTRTSRIKSGWKPCSGNTGQCPVCSYTLPPTSEVTGLASGFTHKIKGNLNCQTKNCIYYWKCIKKNCKAFPECEYIGKTSASFQQRFSQHRDYIKRDVRTEASGQHFTTAGHSVSDMAGMVLEQVGNLDPHVLAIRERHYIRLFNPYRAGLNRLV